MGITVGKDKHGNVIAAITIADIDRDFLIGRIDRAKRILQEWQDALAEYDRLASNADQAAADDPDAWSHVDLTGIDLDKYKP